MACLSCGQPLAGTEPACPRCGRPFIVACPRCGGVVSVGARFCGARGVAVMAPLSVAPVGMPPPSMAPAYAPPEQVLVTIPEPRHGSRPASSARRSTCWLSPTGA
jgi:predicted RNA-binding Zn-ribbon protein involved in translation (DUF1610 family)